MPGSGQSRIAVEVAERGSSVEEEMWECRIGVKEVRLVPLDDWIVTSIGITEL